jgi:hypothetical protein
VFLRSFAERFDDGFLAASTITFFLYGHSKGSLDNAKPRVSELASQETPQNKTTKDSMQLQANKIFAHSNINSIETSSF